MMGFVEGEHPQRLVPHLPWALATVGASLQPPHPGSPCGHARMGLHLSLHEKKIYITYFI